MFRKKRALLAAQRHRYRCVFEVRLPLLLNPPFVSSPRPRFLKNSAMTDADVVAAVDVSQYPDGQPVLLESVFGNSLTYDDTTGSVVSANVFMQVWPQENITAIAIAVGEGGRSRTNASEMLSPISTYYRRWQSIFGFSKFWRKRSAEMWSTFSPKMVRCVLDHTNHV